MRELRIGQFVCAEAGFGLFHRPVRGLKKVKIAEMCLAW